MDHGISDLGELRRQLAGARRSAWVRALVGPAGEQPMALLYLVAVIGPRPHAWSELTWSYEQCTFVSARMTSRRLGSICETGQTREISIGPVRATVEFREGQFSCVHAPSLAQHAELKLPWPSLVYSPPTSLGHVNPPQSYLVGAGDQPSFPSFSGAFNAFFRAGFAVTATQNPQLGTVSIHSVDNRARIRRVRVRPASLEVWLGGGALSGTLLELNGAEWRTVVAVETSRVVLQLPDGLPTDAWLWLKRGSDWLDFRSLSQWGGYQSPDIEVELPKDPLAVVSRLAAQGEGAKLEYKEKLPQTRGEKRTVFKTVVASQTVLVGRSCSASPMMARRRASKARWQTSAGGLPTWSAQW
jgi:hypothetical protein